ncbi:DUF6121 family protein [Leifsonia sp. Leaf264]|uniref:DUF6121 family protein n=1 Tax=Leifsonia sp. Leaf264 TaxID=1736314 RepID=UPI0006F515A2|nr:DUF6121 family protein [Leifsonia sp. Leaf264]KQO97391.1 hypothetical protein ASF30_13150 [Leifsonia sp. Leaf264]
MSVPASQQAPRRIVLTLAVFALAAFLAAVVCAFGFASLITDVAVIDETDAGPLVGPLMVAAAAVVLFCALIVVGIRVDATSRFISLWAILATGVATTAAYLLAGALAYSATTGDAVDAVLFLGHHILRLFTLVVFLLAVVTAVLYLLVLLRQLHGGLRPLWPWEKPGAN